MPGTSHMPKFSPPTVELSFTDMIQGVVYLAMFLMGMCLAAGVVLALAVVAGTHDPASAITWIGTGYYVVVGLMPVTLWLALYLSHNNPAHAAAYATPLRAVLTALQAAVLGSVLGAGPVLLLIVINASVMLTDLAAGTFAPAVRDAIIGQRLILAVAAAAISALPLGLWAHYSGTAWGDR